MGDVEFTDYLGVRTLGSLPDTALGRAVIEELPPGRGCATGPFVLTDTIRQPERERV